MKVPFVDLKSQYISIKDEIKTAIDDVLENTSYILGKHVINFETEFAKMHNVKYCYGVSSGTDGNHSVLWASGIKHGDEVIIPANTFIATAWGATLCGAKPVFVDCHPESYNIDPDKVEAAITPRTKAIVAVHLYGQPADMDRLSEIADKHKILLVEDCAQAHLSEYKGRKVGGLAKAASFSFYPGKNLGAYGEAGAVCTNDDELALKFKSIRDHGSHEKYKHYMFGHNYRMESIQGAVLSVKIKHIEKWTEQRRNAAKLYNDYLGNFEQVKLPKEMEHSKHVFHLFILKLNETDTRNKLQAYLSEKGIGTGLHYPIPLHVQPCFSGLGYKKGDMPAAEDLAECGLSLPMFPDITAEQIEFVCSSIKEYFLKH